MDEEQVTRQGAGGRNRGRNGQGKEPPNGLASADSREQLRHPPMLLLRDGCHLEFSGNGARFWGFRPSAT
jgi:hypothetical protein